MKLIPGKLYKVIYPKWLVELSGKLGNGEMKTVKKGTIILYIEKIYRGRGGLTHWFLDSDGEKISFQISSTDLTFTRFFEEAEGKQ